MRNLVPHADGARGGTPFFMVTASMSRESVLTLHFTQYNLHGFGRGGHG